MLIHKTLVLRKALVPALLISSWFVPHSGAKADIAVDGADPVWNRTIQGWCDNHIAPAYRTQDHIVVRVLNDRQMMAYLEGGQNKGNSDDRQSHQTSQGDDTSDIDGVFEDNPPRVTLRQSGSTMPDMYTFAHEYGHYVWFDVFSGADRKRYEGIYKRQRAQHHLVTDYAATDLEEGFAEAFSFYAAEPSMLVRRDSESSKFLDAWTASHSPTTDRR